MNNRRTIKVKFTDFWASFVPEKSLFYQILAKKYDVVMSDSPEYLFCSVAGDSHLQYDCVKIFYTGENQCPDFNIVDYAIGFDNIIFSDRYHRFPIYLLYGDLYERVRSRIIPEGTEMRPADRDFCSFVCSNNSNSSSDRFDFFNALSKYRQVASGGALFNNVGGRVDDKEAFLRKHKFNIAFENCSYPGYVTEKLVEAFAAGTIPIYWGDPLVTETFNPEAFINCNDYSSWNEVIEAVKRLDEDDELYMKMLTAAPLKEGEPSLDSLINGLREFLYHIIDQPAETVFRYDRCAWMKRYLEIERKKSKLYATSLSAVRKKAAAFLKRVTGIVSPKYKKSTK